MSNGIVTKSEFEGIDDTDVKLNILFETMVAHHEDLASPAAVWLKEV